MKKKLHKRKFKPWKTDCSLHNQTFTSKQCKNFRDCFYGYDGVFLYWYAERRISNLASFKLPINMSLKLTQGLADKIAIKLYENYDKKSTKEFIR
jgi:hypothetical protein